MGITVLSVEDENATFSVLQWAFQECGIPVRLYRAVDGEEALAMLHQAGIHAQVPRPNLILLDLNLPKKGGLEVLTTLQANPEWSSIPVVVFTSSSRASERAKCLALGAVDYITKPMDLDGLIQAVQSVCARAASA
jgi:two-component system, chemotaxis family, response regulator Rcp1